MFRICLVGALMAPLGFVLGLAANPAGHGDAGDAASGSQASRGRDRKEAILPRRHASEDSQLAAGKFLVARRDIPDPFFAETVILLLQYDRKGAMGLIINRPTRMPVSRLLGDLEAAKQRKDPVYLGGPVSPGGVLALFRSEAKPGDARHIFADVYLISSRQALDKAVSSGAGPSRLRLYAGYSGWAPGQLESEMRLGTWRIFQADAEAVFHPDPESVWPRLIRRTELLRATVVPYSAFSMPCGRIHAPGSSREMQPAAGIAGTVSSTAPAARSQLWRGVSYRKFRTSMMSEASRSREENRIRLPSAETANPASPNGRRRPNFSSVTTRSV
jgi:putative transcriptional regulator